MPPRIRTADSRDAAAWRVAVCAALVLAVPGVARSQPCTLTTVGYNMLHGGMLSNLGGDRDELDARLALAVRGMRALEPDFVGLQEASAGPGRGDLAARLGAALGLHHARAASRFRFERIGSILRIEEGPAVLSRFPLRRTEAIPLEGCDDFYQRVLLCASFATPCGPLEACSTHVDGRPCQARRLAVALARRATSIPRLLFGDLNATEDTPGLRKLRALGFVDTFRALHARAPGLTVWQNPASPAPTVRRRVDYVLVAPGAGRRVEVLESRVVLDRPGHAADGTALWPSDHYGVLARVALADEPAKSGGSRHAPR